ncbi:2-keto-4-pentenoate hydratase [Ramlibacter albus]|uniref:Hydratase n=1 Tax=Ramlibacter albus TaxID=2079448 RepID=A0A923M7J8_9BURK|nr:hydratase [Ramlibacter albus]MBC5764174.1 hydratase [Ramlibacter albus]
MTPEELLRHYDDGTEWPGACGTDVHTAYERALSVREMRIARGEKPLGYKVGFTNRTIWPRYGVFAPIWGTVWDSTVTFCEGEGALSLARTAHPRIEPECVFGMARTPPARASLDDLFDSIEWIAPGFEIVQSHQAWKFVAADTVADGGLHARLLVGKRIAVREVAGGAASLEARLAAARVRLKCGNEVKDEGAGASVLDGPMHALMHFLEVLRDYPGATDLQPGDVVTTGTWTDAWPVKAGEAWTGEFDAPLARLSVRFS